VYTVISKNLLLKSLLFLILSTPAVKQITVVYNMLSF